MSESINRPAEKIAEHLNPFTLPGLLDAGRRALRRTEFMARIAAEVDRAIAKHGDGQWGRHEFYGVIKEEFDEMWADIKSDAPQSQLEKEIVQVAAMCFRYFETRDRYREPK